MEMIHMGSVNVADQKGEELKDDYSLDKVPFSKRNMGWLSITNITFGIATAIFYFQLGSVMALQFGAINALISAGYDIVVDGIMGTVIAYFSAKLGMNVIFKFRVCSFVFFFFILTSFNYVLTYIYVLKIYDYN